MNKILCVLLIGTGLSIASAASASCSNPGNQSVYMPGCSNKVPVYKCTSGSELGLNDSTHYIFKRSAGGDFLTTITQGDQNKSMTKCIESFHCNNTAKGTGWTTHENSTFAICDDKN